MRTALILNRVCFWGIAMAGWFYMTVYGLGWPALFSSASPVVLHRDRARRRGAFILAATHFSPYDIPCLMKETPRVLDFVSIVEVFQNPLAAWFLSSMGAFPLDRHRPDSSTVRIILDRLAQGRAVVIFPEGDLRTEQTSVLNGGPLRPGLGRIARLAQVPIVPCVIVGTQAYRRFSSWLPVRRTRYGVNYGPPIEMGVGHEQLDGMAFEARLRRIYRELHEELKNTMESRKGGGCEGTRAL